MRTEQKPYIILTVNKEDYKFYVGNEAGDVSQAETLLHTLRDKLELTAAKLSCDQGVCGACTVILDGDAVPSCTVLTVECDGKEVITLEGLQDKETGELDPLQKAILDHTAYQCGYCTPGVIMAAKALLMKNAHPAREELEEALSGNYCRCGSHHQVIDTIMNLTAQEV